MSPANISYVTFLVIAAFVFVPIGEFCCIYQIFENYYQNNLSELLNFLKMNIFFIRMSSALVIIGFNYDMSASLYIKVMLALLFDRYRYVPIFVLCCKKTFRHY